MLTVIVTLLVNGQVNWKLELADSDVLSSLNSYLACMSRSMVCPLLVIMSVMLHSNFCVRPFYEDNMLRPL